MVYWVVLVEVITLQKAENYLLFKGFISDRRTCLFVFSSGDGQIVTRGKKVWRGRGELMNFRQRTLYSPL